MDISDRRAAPANGPDETEWLTGLNRAILDSALDCIITMDAQGTVREFNPAAERVFGYGREEALGRELAGLIIPPFLREKHRQGLSHYLATGEGPVLGRRIEIPAVRKDGTEILVELAITAYQIAEVPVFTAYLRDITERVRTERRRAAQYSVASLLARSQTIEEAGPEIIQRIAASGPWTFGSIWLKNKKADSLECAATWCTESAKLERFAEVTRATELVGRAGLPGRVAATRQPTWIADIIRDASFVRAAAAAAADLHGGFGFPLLADGAINGVLELFSPEVVQPDDDLLQMVEAFGTQIGFFIHRRKIEQELQRQKEAAEAANAAKDRFLATLSHELRTPLTPILIWAGSTMNMRGLSPEIDEGLRMVSRNIELEARLIDDLLDLTQITRGTLVLHRREGDLHQVFNHALEIVRPKMEEKKLAVELQLEAENHAVVGDAPRLQQVFWNLLGNAVKFTPARGRISVRSNNPKPARVAFEISDTGIGIEPELLGEIFAAFSQTSARREGLGLGLAITRAVVEMHGGTITAASDGPGKGATFRLDLPVAGAADGAACGPGDSVRS